MRSKADISRLYLPHGSKLKSGKYKTKKRKPDMLISIGKQPGESVESVLTFNNVMERKPSLLK